MRRYSNTPPLPKIGHTTFARPVPVAHRIHNVHRRLDPDVIAQLVADYQAGSPSTELMATYGLGKGTVLRLLREHGATIRHQSLTPDQLKEAIQLYREGWSLARVGAQFGRDASFIHTTFKREGIPRRDSHGRAR